MWVTCDLARLLSDLWKPVWHKSFQILAYASHMVFHESSTREPIANFPVFIILHQILTLNPYIKSHKHIGKWLNKNTIKFDME